MPQSECGAGHTGYRAYYTEPHEWVLRLAPLSGGHAALSTRYKECELMKPRKKGQQYEICYRCPGYTKPIYECFPTYEAANLRIAQIEYEKSISRTWATWR